MGKLCPHCGGPLGEKARSLPDHRRFFGLVAAAYRTWPEAHEFQPDSAEHLRAWLICRAGYREATPIMLPRQTSPHIIEVFRLAVEAAVRAVGGTTFVVPWRSGVAVVRPRSIAWDAMSQAEFGEIRAAVEHVLEVEIGASAAALLAGDAEAA